MSKRWGLPESLRVGVRDWPIRSDFRNGLDCMVVLQADDLDEAEKADCVCRIIFPDWKQIYQDGLFIEAAQAAFDFLDCGRPKNESPKNAPAVMEWERDAVLIFDAINKTRPTDIRAEKMHWWSFCGLYMEIGESIFAEVISIRQKRQKGKKLEKYEREFVKNFPQYFTKKANAEVMDDIEEYQALLE